MTIALTHGGSNLYTASVPTNEVLLGTSQGIAIIRRTGPGGAWSLVHRALTDLHVSSIVLEPKSGLVFAGAWHGSVHVSTDGGFTWEKRDNGLPLDDVWSLAMVDQGGYSRVYLGTQPAHLFFTDDLGRNWTEIPSMRAVKTVNDWSFPAPPHIAHTKFISFDPHDSTIIYSCIEQGALLRSNDSGKTWTELNVLGSYSGHTYSKEQPSETFYDCHKILIDPRDTTKLFVSGGAGLYVSQDGGYHWQRWMAEGWESDVYPDGLVLNPRHPDIMFVGAAAHNPATWLRSGFSGSRIFRSVDGGRTWEWLRNGLPEEMMKQEIGALCLEDWGESYSVFAGTTGGEVYSSEDGGDHWSLIVEGLAPISKWGHYALLQTA